MQTTQRILNFIDILFSFSKQNLETIGISHSFLRLTVTVTKTVRFLAHLVRGVYLTVGVLVSEICCPFVHLAFPISSGFAYIHNLVRHNSRPFNRRLICSTFKR